MFSQAPDSQMLEDLDPIMKVWMFHNWWADQLDKAELAKNTAYLIGSFWNPEAVKQLTGEGSNQYMSSDKEFEKSWELVQQSKTESQEPIRKKRKKYLKE